MTSHGHGCVQSDISHLMLEHYYQAETLSPCCEVVAAPWPWVLEREAVGSPPALHGHATCMRNNEVMSEPPALGVACYRSMTHPPLTSKAGVQVRDGVDVLSLRTRFVFFHETVSPVQPQKSFGLRNLYTQGGARSHHPEIKESHGLLIELARCPEESFLYSRVLETLSSWKNTGVVGR